jgi:hypothetical protein
VARQQPAPQRIQPGSQAKAQAPPAQSGDAFAGAVQTWQAVPQAAGSSSARQALPQACVPASQAIVQVPSPGAAPGAQTPRPGPAVGPGQGVQAGPQLASPSTWQEPWAAGAGGGHRRAGALQAKPQPPATQAADAFAGGLQGMQPPPHFRRSPWQT